MQQNPYIAFFLPALAGGGAERVVLSIATNIAGRGFKTDLVVTSSRGDLLNEVPPNVNLVNLSCRRIVTSLLPFSRYLRKKSPTHVLSSMAPTNCIAVLANKITRGHRKLFLVEHSTIGFAAKHRKGRRDRLLPAIIRRTYPFADGIIAVSKSVAKDLEKTANLRPNSVQVIYNPIDLEVVTKKSFEQVSHPWLNPKATSIVVSAGRLNAAKDFPTLIKAMSELRKTHRVRLILLGQGDERSNLDNLVHSLGLEDAVSLPGFVSNPYSYFRNADVFALSSYWEGFGLVLVEALACGTPVVATDCIGGPAEVLGNGRWGKLVPTRDPIALANAIRQAIDQRLIDDQNQSFKLREDGIQRAAEFETSVVVDHYLRAMGIPVERDS